MPPIKAHPLLLPEVSLHISHFVTLEDAIACARVCKDWNDLFTSVVWRTIDCNATNRTFELDPTAIKKHGHRIRVIKGVWGIHDLKVLQGSNLCKLQSLSMILDGTPSIQAYSFDLLRQNIASLTSVEISVSVEEMWSTKVFFPIDAISTRCPGNHAALKLTHLKIASLAFTRGGFSSFLRICPALKVLDIMETNLYSDLSFPEPYQHTGLVQLHTSPQQMLRPDSDSPNEPSLLVHFPKLRKLRIWNPSDLSQPSPWMIRDEVAQHCPLLKEVLIDAPATITAELLMNAFMALTHIMVDHDALSMDVVMGVLSHKHTLECVGSFAPFRGYYEQDKIPILVESSGSALGWAMQLVPQDCLKLTTIRFPLFEMDMDDIEKVTWSCSHLEELFIRIRGLDTQERIDRATALWIRVRTVKRRRAYVCETSDLDQQNDQGEGIAALTNGTLIEDRVARHLVRFERLQRVWLGHGVKKIRIE
ncbi:MAG: hypothetical protein J3Q66DRAFT_409359 [Benniella sp.]|nr:MAG: hypothetical protein J3Q66DRAFT_409359 [Benniella sp.]